MKKFAAIAVVLTLIFTLGACSKVTGSSEEGKSTTIEYTPSSDVKQAFSGYTFVENSDNTNIYVFNEDGTYSETYKGNTFSGGTWEHDSDTDTLILTPEGASYSYNYSIDRDDDGNITGISQYEGRSFTVVTDSAQTAVYTSEAAAADTTVAAEETEAADSTAAETTAE